MTIIFYGHVQAMDTGLLGKVRVRIQIEQSRMLAGPNGTAPIIEVIAEPQEMDVYRIGTGIKIQIQPHDFAANTGGKE